MVPDTNLVSLDPIWTTASVTRDHGYLIYDTLFGMNDQLQVYPQMAAGLLFENGHRTCIIALRPNLTFHDGEPVRAHDCSASLSRWMKRSPLGQTLEARLDELKVVDDLHLRFRFKQPFPLLPRALGAVSTPTPFIMPERIARMDPFKQITEAIGSGPFRFKSDEFNSGSLVVVPTKHDISPDLAGQPKSDRRAENRLFRSH